MRMNEGVIASVRTTFICAVFIINGMRQYKTVAVIMAGGMEVVFAQ